MRFIHTVPCLAAALLLGAAAPAKPAVKTAKPAAKPAVAKRQTIVLPADKAVFDASRVQIIDREKFAGKKGIMLSANAASMQAKPDLTRPDAVFKFNVTVPGRYWITTACDTTGTAREAMKKARTKFEALQIKFTIDGGILRSRDIICPWEDQTFRSKHLMKWDFAAGNHEIRVWLPKDCGLNSLTIAPYYPVRVPAAVKGYKPAIVPGAHPRIWVTNASLEQIKSNLNKGENKAVWARVQAEAARPFAYVPDRNAEGKFLPALHKACVSKAFVYLMTGDQKLGREAVQLMSAYIGAVEFSNILDITREIGQVIYAASLVYDWCYDLFPAAVRNAYCAKLLRLAQDMEIGWPPFGQSIVNGHGNEYQVNRDLLSMSIALYGDDNLPYQYCAYRMFRELVPMRAEEYKSGRHNQGFGYASFRFGAEMHAVWMLKRMAFKEVFDPVIKSVGYYWLYATLPDGRILLDGDGGLNNHKWVMPDTLFLCYTYSKDPVLKGEFERQGGTVSDPVLFLLLNDPALKAEKDLNKLPLSHYFAPPLPSIIARTGWNISENSSDVVVEMKGGDTHFGNHQHADAGAFQIFCRGELATDLGQYHFYGTPYDMGFNKRSIAHNVMLAYQPGEVFLNPRYANDGGQRFIQTNPTSAATMQKPEFRYGTELAAYVGPGAKRPYFSYLWSDLTQAYSSKVHGYTRAACFLNLGNAECPAAMIVVDKIVTARDTKKYWVLNSLTKPVETKRGVEIFSDRDFMRGQLSVNMFLPKDFTREITGNTANVFGTQLNPPAPNAPQAKGFRTMISPKNAHDADIFAAVMLIGPENGKRPAVTCKQGWNNVIFTIGDRIVVLPSISKPQDIGFSFTVPAGKKHFVLLAGLQSGLWNVHSVGNKSVNIEATVEQKSGTVFLILEPGTYKATPGASADETRYTAPVPEVPAVQNRFDNVTAVNGKVLADAKPILEQGRLMVPALPVIKALNGKAEVSGTVLKVQLAGFSAAFTAESKSFVLDGGSVITQNPAAVVRNGWYLAPDVLAGIADCKSMTDMVEKSVFLQVRKQAGELLMITGNSNMTMQDWERLQTEHTGSDYWAVNGTGRTFEVTFRKAKQLNGIGICWAQGAARKAKFKLEVCDGKAWKTVYNGMSYQKNGLEIYSFAPQSVRQIRFTGNGNTLNLWNSIHSFIPQVVKSSR